MGKEVVECRGQEGRRRNLARRRRMASPQHTWETEHYESNLWTGPRGGGAMVASSGRWEWVQGAGRVLM